MSSRKDRFSSQDKNYMKLAINLARSRKGLTGDNPSVGCLIVKNDTIISIGQTGYNGRPHAELSAIKSVFGKNAPVIGSTKSMTGHSLGATGAQEAIYSILMMQHDFIAPSINIET